MEVLTINEIKAQFPDNEVIFKKAFTNKVVFKAFVKDVLGTGLSLEEVKTLKNE